MARYSFRDAHVPHPTGPRGYPYLIFDAYLGASDNGYAIACVKDAHIAEHFVRALNAAEDSAALLRREAQRLSLINQPERADALNDIAESLE